VRKTERERESNDREIGRQRQKERNKWLHLIKITDKAPHKSVHTSQENKFKRHTNKLTSFKTANIFILQFTIFFSLLSHTK